MNVATKGAETMKNITKKFTTDTKFENLTTIEVDGISYSPKCGTLIDEKTAAIRRNLGTFSNEMSEAGYWVTYERSDSTFFAAMGR
jgi:hypothetical protein